MSSWIGLVAPAGTPRAIVAEDSADVVSAMADPPSPTGWRRPASCPVTITPEEFEQYFRDEAERWTKVYKESGIKLD